MPDAHQPAPAGAKIFLSYSGFCGEDVTLFRETFFHDWKVEYHDWLRKGVDPGKDLPEELEKSLDQSRVFVLFLTHDQDDTAARWECEWLIRRVAEDPDWAKTRYIIPVMLSREGKYWWDKHCDESKFPKKLTNLCYFECFDKHTGMCDLTYNRTGTLESISNRKRQRQIMDLRKAVRSWLEENAVDGDGDPSPSSSPGKPPSSPGKIASTVFVLGGESWILEEPSAAERDRLIEAARQSLGPDHRDSVVDVGDNWGLTRVRLENEDRLASYLGTTKHAIIVGDGALLDNFRDLGQGRYENVILSEIDQNLKPEEKYPVGRCLLWLPEALRPRIHDASPGNGDPATAPDEQGKLSITADSVEAMVTHIHELLGVGTDARIVFQRPGREFASIEAWARHKFAECLGIRASAESFPEVDALAGLLASILSDEREKIILVASDTAMNIDGMGRSAALSEVQSQLKSFEIAMDEALQKTNVSAERRVRISRVFLQFRNTKHIFYDVQVNPSSIWDVLRLNEDNDDVTPDPDCLKNLRMRFTGYGGDPMHS